MFALLKIEPGANVAEGKNGGGHFLYSSMVKSTSLFLGKNIHLPVRETKLEIIKLALALSWINTAGICGDDALKISFVQYVTIRTLLLNFISLSGCQGTYGGDIFLISHG